MQRSILRRLYDEALEGIPALGSPADVAAHAYEGADSRIEAARQIVQRHALLSGATGFVCGLPGYFTMPVTIPTNLAGVAALQLHLCASLAALAGRNPQDASVRQRCIACVLDAPSDHPSPEEENEEERESFFRRLAGKMGERGLRFASEQALGALLKGSRSLPLLGGAVGGYSDARSTQRVGQRARRAFLDKPVSGE